MNVKIGSKNLKKWWIVVVYVGKINFANLKFLTLTFTEDLNKY